MLLLSSQRATTNTSRRGSPSIKVWAHAIPWSECLLSAPVDSRRSDVAGPDKLLIASADMRRMAFRAGDWVVARSKQVRPGRQARLRGLLVSTRRGLSGVDHQVDAVLSPYEGLVVLRAWPGPTVPPGTVR